MQGGRKGGDSGVGVVGVPEEVAAATGRCGGLAIRVEVGNEMYLSNRRAFVRRQRQTCIRDSFCSSVAGRLKVLMRLASQLCTARSPAIFSFISSGSASYAKCMLENWVPPPSGGIVIACKIVASEGIS